MTRRLCVFRRLRPCDMIDALRAFLKRAPIQRFQGTAHVMATPISTSDSDTTERTRHILLVEDEPAISGFVRRGLIFEGYDVQVVEDGREALDAIRDGSPDLLILDLMLPNVDGINVTRRIRAAESADGSTRLPILMLTARDSVADRVAGLDAGADDYLVKPFDFEELVARVRALLRRTRRLKQLLRTRFSGMRISKSTSPVAPLAVVRSSWS